MKKSLVSGSSVLLLVVACISMAGAGLAQDISAARPMFTALPPHNNFPNAKQVDPAAQLPQWTFNWTSSFDNRSFNSVIVGTDPRTTNSSTTVTVGIIPIKMVYGASNGNMTFDPDTTYFGNYTATQMVSFSPIFKSYFDYNQGGTDLGKTQYIDAYQRGNFWGSVQTNNNYHILLKTVLGPTQTFTVPASEGNVAPNEWSGIPTGLADINWFDNQLQGVINKFKQIQPNVLPLFITYNVYLTSGGCCFGGYHSANGPQPGGQTYSYATVISQAKVPVFSQDVGALSHEIGEWLMDPFVDNASPCPNNGILENGDPLETETGVHQFGDWPYTIQGFTFHPQDLVFITWFGAPPATSVNDWVTFQGQKLAVCQVGR